MREPAIFFLYKGEVGPGGGIYYIIYYKAGKVYYYANVRIELLHLISFLGPFHMYNHLSI